MTHWLLHKNQFWFILIAIGTTVLGMLSSIYLPDRFLADAGTIVLDRYDEIGWLGSYPFTIGFYEVTGLKNLHYSIVALIQVPILFYVIYKLGVPLIFQKPILRNLVLWTQLLLIAVFVSYPSKEFINIIYMGVIALIIIRPISLRKKVAYSFVLFALFSVFFRPYYFLVPVIALGIYLIHKISIRNRALSNIIVGLLVTIFISLSYGVVKGNFMSQDSREELNYKRLEKNDQDADTMILSPVPVTNIAGESVSILYGFFTVNVPLNGFRFWYKPQVIIFLFFQLVLFYLLFVYYSRVSRHKKFSHEQWVLHLVFAYFILQGVFEPDLGSAIRHKIGILPLIWLAIYYDQKLIKRPKFSRKYVFKNV